MKRLFSCMKDYKLEGILGPLFEMLEANFELFVPLVVARMMDAGIQGKDSGYTLKMGGVPVLLALIGLACSLTAQYFAARAAIGTATFLCNDLFSYIGKLSYTEIDTMGAVASITKMTSDISQIQSGINIALHLLLRSLLVVFGAMIMALAADVRSALVFVVTIPVLCVVVFGIMAVSMPLYKSVQRQLDKVLLIARENLLGVRVIRVSNRQKSETERLGRENGSLVRMQAFVGKISVLLNPMTYVIINIAMMVVTWVGAEQADSAVLTQGKVTVLVSYMSQIPVELMKMANLITVISKAVACMNQVDGVFQVENNIEDRGTSGMREHKSQAPKVELKDVEFVYAGAKEPVLQGISFCAIAGQTIGITGGTGFGKPTLVNLIPRFYDATSGQVLVDGTDAKGYSLDGLREKMGMVPQKPILSKGTLRDDMHWGKQDASDKDTYRASDTAQTWEFAGPKGEGLNLYTDQGGHNPSRGQRQRLTIARTLVRKPEILITDDSAPALDYATDTRLRGAIRENVRDMAVFTVSWRVTTIKGADIILVLDEGRLAGMGAHKEFLKDCQVYGEICPPQSSREEVGRGEQ